MKNKKTVVKVIAIILALTIIVGVAIAIIYNKNVMLADNENKEVQKQTQELVLEDNKYMHVETDASGDKVPVPDPSKFYGTDANGKRWGKNYTFTTGTNSSITFDEETGTYAKNWRESNEVMSLSSSTSYREPDVVVRSEITGFDMNDMDSRLRTLGLGAETTHEFLIQLEKEFNKMIDSIEKYGGFYIGRYETGDLGKEQAVVQKGNTDINYQTWYTMYKKCKELENANTAVKTGMIWGNQFDRTLIWLIESGEKTKEEVISNSTSWGNYIDATFQYTNSSGSTVTKKENYLASIPTGSSDYTKANNIYDLAGNVYDWTMEAYSTHVRVLRGGRLR